MATELRKFRHQIVLDVSDFLCPHEVITEIIGVEPTYARVKGQKRTHAKAYTRSYWALYSYAEEYDSEFEEHVENFLKMVGEKDDAILQIQQIAKVEMTIICTYNGASKPAVHFDLPFLSFLNRNRIPVDIDFYV
jgi:hypothetical protein